MVLKLSKTQQEIVQLMKNGWELGIHHAYFSDSWIQKDGLGKGGESKNVSITTIWALEKKGVIERKEKEGFLSTFRLTKEGGEKS